MAIQELESFAHDLVSTQQRPPRQFPLSIITHALFARDVLLVGLFGLSGVLAGVGNILRPATDPTPKYIVAGLAFFFGGILFLIPFLSARTWYVALRRGRLATARVIELKGQGRGATGTFRSFEGGSATGTWTVALPDTTFTDAFSVDSAWAANLHIGSQVRVLVHPTRNRVLVELGP